MGKTNKEWAIYYLNRGISIIPCGTGKANKAPFISTWREYIQRLPTLEEVNQWWNKNPNAKIGVILGKISNLVVVDIDNVEKFKQTGIILPKTPIVKTVKGFHYYFCYPKIDFRTTILPFGEIRSNGSYVIAPPSSHHTENNIIDGEYIWSISLEDEEMPEFDYNIFKGISKEVENRNSFESIATGVDYGDGRNNAAAIFIGGMLKKYPRYQWNTKVWPLTLAWNLSVEKGKGWDEKELLNVFNSICNTELKNNKEIISYNLISFKDLKKEKPDPDPFLVQDIIKKNSLNIIHGATGCGKSLFVLKMVDDITLGNDFLGHFKTIKSRCLIIDMEMTKDDCIVRSLDICDDKNDSILSVEKSWSISNVNSMEWLKNTIYEYNIKLVVFDTFSKIHLADENNNSEITKVMISLLDLCNEHKITILLLHHINKSKDSEGLGRGRGASAIADNAGSYLEIKSKKIKNPLGETYLVMSVKNEKNRRRESINSFDLSIYYDKNNKKTVFEFLGESTSMLDPINKARDEILRLINNEQGLNKTQITKKLEKIGVSRDVILNAISGLLAEKKLRCSEIGNAHLIYINENIMQEELNINEINF